MSESVTAPLPMPASVPPAATLEAPARYRIQSLDIFRGLTLAVMIFVNQLSGVHGLPWWTYHAHAMEDRMTYVDMVFPTFLFIVGVAMPIAISSRLRKNSSHLALWGHILLRSFSLLVLGLILANADNASRDLMHMSGYLWAILALLSCCLYLNVYPKSVRFPHYATILRYIGLAGAIVLLAIFRRSTPAGPAWLDFGYPEILGLIAISYFASAILYVPTRNLRWMQPVWLVLLVAFNAGCFLHLFGFTNHLSLYVFPWGNGAMPSIIFAGIVTANLLFPPRDNPGAKPKIALTLGFGLLMIVAAVLLSSLGISKIRATPTWCLGSAGVAAILLAALYWLCDVKGHSKWAWLLVAAGGNGLLTYLLPDFWDYISAVTHSTWYDWYFNHGTAAVLKTVAFTILILLIAKGLTRLKLRLQL
jgi:predicted acyltransferase